MDDAEKLMGRKLVVGTQPAVDASFLERQLAMRGQRLMRDLVATRGTRVDPSRMAAAASDPKSLSSSDSVEGRVAT